MNCNRLSRFFFARFLSGFLIFSLGLPPSAAYGLRPMADQSGLEEALHPSAGLEEIHPVFLDPTELPGFEVTDVKDLNQLVQHQQTNVLAMLRHWSLPPGTKILNVGSGILPLKLPEEWGKEQPINLDPQPFAKIAAARIGARYAPVDLTYIAAAVKPDSSELLPGVVLLYRMGSFVEIYQSERSPDFWKEVWTVVRPGGWLLMMNPSHQGSSMPSDVFVPASPLEKLYSQLLDALRAAKVPLPSRVEVVNPSRVFKDAIAIAIQKPTAGLEEEILARTRIQILVYPQGSYKAKRYNEYLTDLLTKKTQKLYQRLQKTPLFRAEPSFELLLIRNGMGLNVHRRGSPQRIYLEEILKNSIDNFAQLANANEKTYPGEITVRLGRIGGKWFLELSDNGNGISRPVLEGLFRERYPGGHRKNPKIYLGGEGRAFSAGFYGNQFLQENQGSIVIETRHPETGAYRLKFEPGSDPSDPFIQIEAGSRLTTGTTVRWIFRAAAGMEEASAGGEQDYQMAPLSEVDGLGVRLEWANRLGVYWHRLVKQKRDGRWRYFLVKSRSERLEEVRGRAVWPDINNPIREVIAVQLLRALRCNVCDVEIPDAPTRIKLARMVGMNGVSPDPDFLYLVQLSSNYSLGDPEVIQEDPLKQPTRKIGAGTFMRLWDIHPNNSGPVPGSEVSMMFDAEQAFHPRRNKRGFVLQLMVNYFALHILVSATVPPPVSSKVSTNLPPPVKNLPRPKEKKFEVDPFELLDWIDVDELGDLVRDVAALDLGAQEEEVTTYLLRQYGGERREWLVSEIKPIFNRLRNWQKFYPEDVIDFFNMILSGVEFGGTKIGLHLDGDAARDQLERKRKQIQDTLKRVAQELASKGVQGSVSAGLEEKKKDAKWNRRRLLTWSLSLLGLGGLSYVGYRMTRPKRQAASPFQEEGLRATINDPKKEFSRRAMTLKLEIPERLKSGEPLIAVPFVKTDKWYPQPSEDARAGFPVGKDDWVTVETREDHSPFVGENQKGVATVSRAVAIFRNWNDFNRFMEAYRAGDDEAVNRTAIRIFEIDANGNVKAVSQLEPPPGWLERLLDSISPAGLEEKKEYGLREGFAMWWYGSRPTRRAIKQQFGSEGWKATRPLVLRLVRQLKQAGADFRPVLQSELPLLAGRFESGQQKLFAQSLEMAIQAVKSGDHSRILSVFVPSACRISRETSSANKTLPLMMEALGKLMTEHPEAMANILKFGDLVVLNVRTPRQFVAGMDFLGKLAAAYPTGLWNSFSSQITQAALEFIRSDALMGRIHEVRITYPKQPTEPTIDLVYTGQTRTAQDNKPRELALPIDFSDPDRLQSRLEALRERLRSTWSKARRQGKRMELVPLIRAAREINPEFITTIPNERLSQAERLELYQITDELIWQIFLPAERSMHLRFDQNLEAQIDYARIDPESWHSEPYLGSSLLWTAQIQWITGETEFYGEAFGPIALVDPVGHQEPAGKIYDELIGWQGVPIPEPISRRMRELLDTYQTKREEFIEIERESTRREEKHHAEDLIFAERLNEKDLRMNPKRSFLMVEGMLQGDGYLRRSFWPQVPDWSKVADLTILAFIECSAKWGALMDDMERFIQKGHPEWATLALLLYLREVRLDLHLASQRPETGYAGASQFFLKAMVESGAIPIEREQAKQITAPQFSIDDQLANELIALFLEEISRSAAAWPERANRALEALRDGYRRNLRDGDRRKQVLSEKGLLAAGLEEKGIAQGSPVGGRVSRMRESAGTLGWARPLAEKLRPLGVRVLDGLADVTDVEHGQGRLAPGELFNFLESEDRALLVPVRAGNAASITETLTIWAHPGMQVPDAWRKLGVRVESLPIDPGEAEKVLREAKSTDLVILNAAFGSQQMQPIWAGLLARRGLAGLWVPADADLTGLTLDDLAVIRAILDASGQALYVLAIRAVDLEGQRHLLVYL